MPAVFPGQKDDQLLELEGTSCEWSIDWIRTHRGNNADLEFQVDWTSGDQTWIPYLDLVGLTALGEYFNFLGIEKVSDLQMSCEGTLRHLLDKDTMEHQGT